MDTKAVDIETDGSEMNTKPAKAVKGLNRLTLHEGKVAPEGYEYSHKRIVKNCKSCRWWQPHTDARVHITPTKKKRRACTQVPLTDRGMPIYHPVSGVAEKGPHYGERTDPMFHCDNFLGKSMPLVKIKEDAE